MTSLIFWKKDHETKNQNSEQVFIELYNYVKFRFNKRNLFGAQENSCRTSKWVIIEHYRNNISNKVFTNLFACDAGWVTTSNSYYGQEGNISVADLLASFGVAEGVEV